MNFLLKPAFEKHLPRVTLFLERCNFFERKNHEENETKVLILNLSAVIAKTFKDELQA
jgi:hypothetical protein